LYSVPVGDQKGVLIVGPIDNPASLKALDALLKTIEEIPSEYMIPILWAEDLGGVITTIRSRCIDVWAPGTKGVNKELEDLAKQIVANVLNHQFGTLPVDVVSNKETDADIEEEPEEGGDSEKKSGKKPKFKGVELLWAISDVLAENLSDPDRRFLWERVRKVALWRNPTPLEIVSALIE
jgi:hypothetical protein